MNKQGLKNMEYSDLNLGNMGLKAINWATDNGANKSLQAAFA